MTARREWPDDYDAQDFAAWQRAIEWLREGERLAREKMQAEQDRERTANG
jgi:hypothetical protein